MYVTYSVEELRSMVSSIESDLRQEEWASNGGGLRAEVARANVAEFRRQLDHMTKELSTR